MRKKTGDPKNGSQKVTNEDEQEVVVNHSTADQGGYDEPVDHHAEADSEVPPQKTERSKPESESRRANDPVPGKKRKFHDEETE